MVHFKVGALDGVSIEMEIWRKVLEKRFGHRVTYLAGSVGQTNGHIVQEMELNYEPNLKIMKNAFSKLEDFDSEKALELEIKSQINQIKPKIRKFIDDCNIDFMIPNNLLSHPLNIPASVALIEVIREKKIPGISHNHDFFWERTYYRPTCSIVQEYLQEYFPPDLPNFQHVVINSIAQFNLRKRRGIESTVVPNVFDFKEHIWSKDEYNSDLRETLGINENDLIFLQPSQILETKGIELAIDLINELNQTGNLQRLRDKPLYNGRKFGLSSKIILVMPNSIQDFIYQIRLEKKLQQLNIEYRFCDDYFAQYRYQSRKGTKNYSLWDIYVHSDIITYPSLLEGWGNQFLEAINAKIPVYLFEYDVYKQDIGPLGFETISLGSEIKEKDEFGLVHVSNDVIKEASKKVVLYLQDAQFREEAVEKNYQIGLEKLSLKALGNYIEPLLKSFTE